MATTPPGGRPGEVYQTSTIGALLDGVYEGDVTIGELLEHGDFGLGTFDRLDGEMLVLDGTCHHLYADGTVDTAGDGELTPFAAVTRFEPELRVPLTAPCDRQALLDQVDDAIAGSENLIHAVRVTGTFEAVHTRTVREQRPPYPPLTEAAAGQQESLVRDTAGTLAGFRTPAFEQGISVAGYHLHFVDDERRHGGHVLGFRLTHGTAEIGSACELRLHLPRTPQFQHARLSPADAGRRIRQAEGS